MMQRWVMRACVFMCGLGVSAYGADNKENKGPHFCSYVLEGDAPRFYAMPEKLRYRPSSDPLLQELALGINDLMRIALSTRCCGKESAVERFAAQECILVLVEKGISGVVEYVTAKAPEIVFISRSGRSIEFWRWVIQLFTLLRFDTTAKQEHLLTMCVQETLHSATTAESAFVRRDSALLFVEMTKRGLGDRVIKSAVRSYEGIDIPALLKCAVVAPDGNERRAAQAAMEELLKWNNCNALTGLKEYLEDRSLAEPVYDFSRLIVWEDSNPYAFFERLLCAGGESVQTLFLGPSVFEHVPPSSSSLAGVMALVKELSVVSVWWKTRGWIDPEGALNFAWVRKDATGKGSCQAIDLLKDAIMRIQGGGGSPRHLALGDAAWCGIFRILTDAHLLWWIARHMPQGYETTSVAAALSRRVKAMHDACNKKNAREARRAYEEVRALIHSHCSIDSITRLFL